MLVDGYFAHLYVGEFLKMASNLMINTRILVMQAKPSHGFACFYGTPRMWPAVDKTEIAQVIQAVGITFRC